MYFGLAMSLMSMMRIPRARSWLAFTGQGRYVGESFLSNTGDRRFMTPSFWLADAGATLTLKRIAGVGHFMMREAPDLVVDEVGAFLRGGP